MATAIYSNSIAIRKAAKDGRSVKSITAYYAKNDSDTEAPTTGWATSGISPTPTERYLWYKEVTVYSDSTEEIQTTPVVIGVYGEKGEDGVSGKNPVSVILSTPSYTLTAVEKNVIDGTVISTVVSVVQSVNGIRQAFTYVSSTPTENGTFYITATATGITYISVDGAVVKGSSGSAMTADTATIDVTVYYKDFDGESATVTQTIPISQAIKGNTGAYTLYQYALSTELTAPTDGWTDTMQSVTEEYPYLWIKVGKVSAGGSDSDAVWSEASLVGTDIVSVASDVAGNKSLIESMGNKIALKLVDGEVTTTDEKVIAGLSIGTDSAGEGYIKLNASKTIVEGSITATEINAGAITADKLDAGCLSGKTFKVQNDGAIQSADYEEGVKGFRLSADGDLDANSATLKDVTITDGTLKSNAIRTLNDEVTGSWCCAPAFPVEDGTSTTEVAVAGKSLVRSETCYFNGKEFAQWCLDNIPVNNTEFTKLDGTIDGRNVYAVRFNGTDTWKNEYSVSGKRKDTDSVHSFTVDCGKYRRALRVAIKISFSYTINSGSVKIPITLHSDEGDSSITTAITSSPSTVYLPNQILSSGTHSCSVTIGKNSDIVAVSFGLIENYTITATSSVNYPAVYGNNGLFQLRLYSGDDDSAVFEGDDSTTPLEVISFDDSSLPSRYTRLASFSINTTAYSTLPISLASCKAGKGITGWTLTRYGKFAGLYEVGINQTWVDTPSFKASGIYRASSVTIGGTTYEKDFTINWNASQLSVYSDDGTVSRVYTAGNYYSSWDSIVYTETAEDAGVYVSNLYPKSSESVIGSVTQPFKEAWINDIKGALTGNVTGNLTGDVTGNLIGNVNAIGTENKVYGAKFTVDVLYEGTMGGYKTYTLKKDIVKYGYEWVVVYAKSNSSGYWMGPTWFHTSLLSSFTGSSNKLVCAAQSSYWIVYFVSSSQIYINDSSTGTFRIYGIK